MDYQRFGEKLLVRLDRGEEILGQLKLIAESEKIKLAGVTALGATNDITVGVLETVEKKYRANSFCGDMEIVSLSGTISTMNGEFYPHLHMSCAKTDGSVVGGHLNRAVISATCEMIIEIINGEVDRAYDDITGLNLFKFAK